MLRATGFSVLCLRDGVLGAEGFGTRNESSGSSTLLVYLNSRFDGDSLSFRRELVRRVEGGGGGRNTSESLGLALRRRAIVLHAIGNPRDSGVRFNCM